MNGVAIYLIFIHFFGLSKKDASFFPASSISTAGDDVVPAISRIRFVPGDLLRYLPRDSSKRAYSRFKTSNSAIGCGWATPGDSARSMDIQYTGPDPRDRSWN